MLFFYLRSLSPKGAVLGFALVLLLVAALPGKAQESNDPPAFTRGADVVTAEDAGPQSLAWATSIAPGPVDEAAQSLSFLVSHDQPALFSVPPPLMPPARSPLRPPPTPTARPR